MESGIWQGMGIVGKMIGGIIGIFRRYKVARIIVLGFLLQAFIINLVLSIFGIKHTKIVDGHRVLNPVDTYVTLAIVCICVSTMLYLIIKHLLRDKNPQRKQITIPIPTQIKKEAEKPYSLRFETYGQDLYIHNPFRSILCIGSAGSGKSESIERQLMKSAVDKEFCGLLYDFKYPSLTNELESFLKAKNSKLKHYNINFTDLSTSSRVNPLHPRYILNASYAREYATSIVNNLLPESIEKKDFWTRSCTDLLTAVIFYLSQETPQYSTLPHVVCLVFQDEKKLIPLLCKNLQCMGMIKSLETALRNESNEQLTGVVSTLQSVLSVINSPEIFYILSGDEVNLNVNDPNNPIWLSLGNSPLIPETYSPLLSLISTVALKQMNQQGKHHSIVILDEAPTLFIPKLDLIPATARSNKLSLAFFAQDISQVVQQYGQKNADVILSNLNNQFFGRVSNPKTAEYISKMFGKTDQYFEQYSESKGQNHSFGQGYTTGSNDGNSTSTVIQERDRIKPQEIIHFEVGRFCGILVEGENNEFNTKFKRIDCEPYKLSSKLNTINVNDLFKQIHAESAAIIEN